MPVRRCHGRFRAAFAACRKVLTPRRRHILDERNCRPRAGLSAQAGLRVRSGRRASRTSRVTALRRQMGGYLHSPLATLGAGVEGMDWSLASAACGGGASRAARISLRRLARQRLARKPKWRTRGGVGKQGSEGSGVWFPGQVLTRAHGISQDPGFPAAGATGMAGRRARCVR